MIYHPHNGVTISFPLKTSIKRTLELCREHLEHFDLSICFELNQQYWFKGTITGISHDLHGKIGQVSGEDFPFFVNPLICTKKSSCIYISFYIYIYVIHLSFFVNPLSSKNLHVQLSSPSFARSRPRPGQSRPTSASSTSTLKLDVEEPIVGRKSAGKTYGDVFSIVYSSIDIRWHEYTFT